MLKVLRNLKESAFSVIAIVLLLCIQATTDLALPDYTSKIVNTGIQAGGIESSIPDLISKENMDTVLLFTDKDNEILDNYILVDNEQEISKYEDKMFERYYGKKYNEKITNKSIYLLKELDEEDKDKLSKLISLPLLEMGIITDTNTADKIKEQIVENMPDEQKEYIKGQELTQLISRNARRTKK